MLFTDKLLISPRTKICNLSSFEPVLWMKKQVSPESQALASRKKGEENGRRKKENAGGFSRLLRRNALCGHDAENDGREKGGPAFQLRGNNSADDSEVLPGKREKGSELPGAQRN
jgi:hypothetical protein